jgi:hypothetical protein
MTPLDQAKYRGDISEAVCPILLNQLKRQDSLRKVRLGFPSAGFGFPSDWLGFPSGFLGFPSGWLGNPSAEA